MLILNRRPGEKVIIGGEVEVTVTCVTTDPNGSPIVELGILAPKHVTIDREEVHLRRVSNVNRVLNGND